MSLNFFQQLKENLEQNDTLSNIGNTVTNFIEELKEALDEKKNQDIVSQLPLKIN